MITVVNDIISTVKCTRFALNPLLYYIFPKYTLVINFDFRDKLRIQTYK